MTLALHSPTATTPVVGGRSVAACASLRDFDGRPVSWFRLEGGKHRGAIGIAEGDTLVRAVHLAVELGVPVVGVLATSGADVHEGVAALHAWGRVARALTAASGVVPTVLVVVGPCVSGPALLLGLADHVVMTADAFAYVTGPAAVRDFTGVTADHDTLGGAAVHDQRTGVASIVAADEDDALLHVTDLLAYLPANHLDDPPRAIGTDPADRGSARAAGTVPAETTASYDMRVVVDDVLDMDSFYELRAAYAPNLVTGLGRLDGRTVSVVANQPQQRAGTLDIEASRKAARFVQWCDAFNVPLLTFVDTPGFEPGRDLEWRGMIRHGAQLVHAYGEATVPRLCVVVRKAYGGAYIVMDSKELGNDICFAWPTAQIAVMGAPGAVQILHGRRLRGIADDEARVDEQQALEAEYEERFANPYVAATRGYVDEVIDPADTRRALVGALSRLVTKRELQPSRRHSNGPL